MRMAYYSKRNVTDKFNIFIIIINNEKSSLKKFKKKSNDFIFLPGLSKEKDDNL